MPKDPRKLRILVSNDDGIHAPGLDVAEVIARSLSDDVWIVAPETEQSGASHSLTLTTLNGHTVSSGDWYAENISGGGRSVSYSLFPSELIGRVTMMRVV